MKQNESGKELSLDLGSDANKALVEKIKKLSTEVGTHYSMVQNM